MSTTLNIKSAKAFRHKPRLFLREMSRTQSIANYANAQANCVVIQLAVIHDVTKTNSDTALTAPKQIGFLLRRRIRFGKTSPKTQRHPLREPWNRYKLINIFRHTQRRRQIRFNVSQPDPIGISESEYWMACRIGVQSWCQCVLVHIVEDNAKGFTWNIKCMKYRYGLF